MIHSFFVCVYAIGFVLDARVLLNVKLPLELLVFFRQQPIVLRQLVDLCICRFDFSSLGIGRVLHFILFYFIFYFDFDFDLKEKKSIFFLFLFSFAFAYDVINMFDDVEYKVENTHI